MDDCANSFDTFNVWDDGVDVDAAADSYSIAFPTKGARLAGQVNDMAEVGRSAADFDDLCLELNHRSKVEVRDIVLEILDVDLGSHKIRGIVWEAKVRKRSQILG